MDTGTLTSSSILFLITAIIIYGIFRVTKPSLVMNKDKIDIWKPLYISIIFSLLFTLIITFVSVKVDIQKKTN